MKKSSRIIVILGIVLLVGGLGVGVYFLLKDNGGGSGGNGKECKQIKAYEVAPDGYTCTGEPDSNCEVKCCKNK